MAKKIISIDIGTDTIKIVEAQNGKEIHIFNAITIPTPDKAIEDGFIRDKQMLANVISAALNQAKIKTKEVVFTVASTKIITREVTMPAVKPDKLAEMIRMNASEYFPVNINDYIIDQKILETVVEDGAKQAKVLIAVAPINLMTSYSELADLLKLKINALDFSGNSIVQIAKLQFLKGLNMVLELGNEATTVTIMNNEKLELQRHVPHGTKSIYGAVMSHFDVGYAEAVEMMEKKQLLHQNADTNPYLAGDITSALNQILSGVNRIVDYYSSRYSDKGFDRIYIYGNGGQILGIDRFIEKFFNVHSEIVDRLYSVQFKDQTMVPTKQSLYAVAIGAVVAPFNLAPAATAKASSEGGIVILIACAAFAAIIVVACFMIPKLKMDESEEAKEDVKSKINELQYIEETYAEYDKQKAKLDVRTNAIAGTTYYTKDIIDILNRITELVPANTIFDSLLLTPEGINYASAATTIDTVAKTIQQFKKIPYFYSISTKGYKLEEDYEVYLLTMVPEDDSEDATKVEENRQTMALVDIYEFELTCLFKTPYEKIEYIVVDDKEEE